MPPDCPRCGTPLAEHRPLSAPGRRCPSGHGWHFPRESVLDRLGDEGLRHVEEAFRAAPSGAVPCPECKAPMHALQVTTHGGTVEVDGCEGCRAY